eukprot:TRINITY_DN35224_c0_g1_i1.p1 TRINITY_DN35224_c0_g1~~TRINITY_DN35224_c0_g1_i1.p1  ORF type:complete len:617 (+),score=80.50 TRINITY_DN35224_c0_g1_i1:267-1853(+)
MLSGTIIILNSVVVVCEAEFEAMFIDGRLAERMLPMVFLGINSMFLAIYAAESAVKLYVYKQTFPRDPWNIFDVTLVCTCLMADLLGGFFPSLTFMRMLRVARLGKLLRLMSGVSPTMYRIVHGFIHAMRSIVCASVLLFFIMTVWATIAIMLLHPIAIELCLTTDVYGKCDRCCHAWSSVMQANLTFLQTILIGDSWGKYAIPIVDHSPWTISIFIGFFMTVTLGICNLITSLIVDHAAEARSKDEVEEYRKKLWCEAQKCRLMDICRSIDTDGDGMITMRELRVAWDMVPCLSDVARKLNVTKCELESLCTILDRDGNGYVNSQEFANALVHASMTDVKSHVLALRTELMNLSNRLFGEKEVGRVCGSMYGYSTADGRDTVCSAFVSASSKKFTQIIRPVARNSQIASSRPLAEESSICGSNCSEKFVSRVVSETSSATAEASDVVALESVILLDAVVPLEHVQRPKSTTKQCRVGTDILHTLHYADLKGDRGGNGRSDSTNDGMDSFGNPPSDVVYTTSQEDRSN